MADALKAMTANMNSGIKVDDYLQVSDYSTEWKRVAATQRTDSGAPLIVFADYTTRVLTAEGRSGNNPTWFDILRPQS